MRVDLEVVVEEVEHVAHRLGRVGVEERRVRGDPEAPLAWRRGSPRRPCRTRPRGRPPASWRSRSPSMWTTHEKYGDGVKSVDACAAAARAFVHRYTKILRSTSASTMRVDVGVQQRLAAGDRAPSARRTPPSPPSTSSTLTGAAQDVGRVLDLAAARAGQVAGEQRLELDDQRELARGRRASARSRYAPTRMFWRTGMGISGPRREGRTGRPRRRRRARRRWPARGRRGGRRPAATRCSGAEAPAVIADGAGAGEPRRGRSRVSSSTRWAATPVAAGDLDEAVGVRRVRRADDEHQVALGGDARAPPPGGSGWRSRCRRRAGRRCVGKRSRSAATTSAVSSRASVVWVR